MEEGSGSKAKKFVGIVAAGVATARGIVVAGVATARGRRALTQILAGAGVLGVISVGVVSGEIIVTEKVVGIKVVGIVVAFVALVLVSAAALVREIERFTKCEDVVVDGNDGVVVDETPSEPRKAEPIVITAAALDPEANPYTLPQKSGRTSPIPACDPPHSPSRRQARRAPRD